MVPATSSIGDRVWLDLDADGVQDSNEIGLNGVTLAVVFLGADGQPGGGDDVTYNAQTSGNGDWRVSGIPAGKYIVTVTGGVPAGVVASYDADSNTSRPDQTSMIVIDGDENDQDFGYTYRASIGDTVFTDNNNNGRQDDGERGIEGVQIRITNLGADGERGGGDDTVIGTFTTNGQGRYLAAGLLDGTYAVDVVGGVPDGVELTVDPQGTNNPDGLSVTAIANGQDDLSQDFGYTVEQPTGGNTIGDTVFNDINRNGVDDGPATDPRLPGVDVLITWFGPDGQPGGGDDVVIGTFTTDENGRYEATGLPDGRFSVVVVGGLPLDFEPTVDPQGTDNPDGQSTVTVIGGQTNRDQDFGYAETVNVLGSIGDRVYNDTNLDGSQGDPADEPGIPDVRVVLVTPGADGQFGTADDVTDVRITDGNGNYLFGDLPAGEYRVEIDESTLPNGFENTDDEDGNTNSSTPVTLGENDDHLTADFGYGQDGPDLGSIGDRIYLDSNGDGVQGDPADEPGIPGVIVRLTGAGEDGVLGTGDDVVTEQQTDGDGNYLFEGLLENIYRIDVIGGVVDGLTNTDDPDGGGDSSSIVSLDEGDNRTDQDFGYDPGDPADAFLGDRVWFDNNRNGVQDAGERGINGVTVTLTLPDGTTRSTETAGNGDYLFTGLESGEYTVTVGAGLPTGLVATYDADDRLASPDGESTTQLTTSDLDQDFGYVGTGSIGDTISLVQGNELTGMPGVVVTITDLGADGQLGTDDDVVYTRVTDKNGRYLVTGLPAGEYQVDVDESTLPDGLVPSSDPDNVLDSSSRLTLAPGETDLDQDFSYAGIGRIGDTVYLDTNGDGDQDDPVDEPGIGGVTVRLTASGSDLVLTAITDENGKYIFDGLPAGEYTVEVLGGLPAGVDNTDDPDGPAGNGDSTSVVTIGSGLNDSENLDQDFGYNTNSLLGDRVWLDLDSDGVQDAGEPGINGVTVTATNGAGQSFTATTEGDGDYLFTELIDGTYTVSITGGIPAGLAPTYDADSGLNNVDETSTTDLVGSDLDQDFGYVGTGSIGDTIFADDNADGTQDDDEAGVPNVVVMVTGAGQDGQFGTADDIVITTTTDDDGNYDVTGLPAGDYIVDVDESTLPAGYAIVTDPDGVNDGVSTVTLAPGENNDEQDFGTAIVGSIGNTVYLDTNGDGEQGDPADEPGLPGVTVTLTDEDGVVRTTTTDDDGNYVFENLPAGDYTVAVTGGLPDNVDNTGDPDGNADGGDLGDSTSEVTLLPGEDNLDQDFGYDADSLLGDRVWFDRNRDGVQDADEPGINGVTVTATNDAGETFTTTTDGDGDYLFTELTDGTYTVTVTAGVPAGFGPTADADTQADGTNTAGDETSTTDLVTADLDQDFGYAGNSSLGDFIWLDRDGDGVLDDDESGLPGVRVTVTWAGPDGQIGTADDITFDDVTDENGEYLVDGLPAGNYEVAVDESSLPDGAEQTFGLAGGNENPQSSVQVNLPADTFRDDVDFAYRGNSSIGDTVFLDRNDDGVQDDNEPGIPDVAVTLTFDGVTLEAVTDEIGEYLFEGLLPGDYVVDVDETTLPEGLRPTVDEDGGVATDGGDPDGTTPVELGENDDHLTADFGYVSTIEGRIGDTIFLDLNGNGTQDDGEPGVPGQTVVLTDENGVVDVAVTDEDGEYLFDGLPDGTYTVTVEGGIADLAVNSADPDDGTPNTSEVVIEDGSREDLDQDFGYAGENSVGDTVFFDANADGLDGDDAEEPGIPGVDVVVTWFGPDGLPGTADDVVYAAATTDGSGEYVVEGLPDGTFSVGVDETTLPAGVNPTVDVGDAAGGNPGAPIDGTSTVILGDEGVGPEDDRDQDFGYVAGGSISGTIVLDQNGDGIEDPAEQGLPGIRVTLVGAGPDGEFGTADDLLRETTTDENGDYSFPGLPAGEYVVDVDEDSLPEGVEITFDDDDGTDDPDGAMPVTLGENEDRDDVDAGYVGPGSISGVIYADTNGNGTQDDDEPGVPGQPITVTDVNGVVYETTTDENGEYSVEGLPDGVYTVVVDGGITDSAQNTEDPDGGTPNESTVTLDPDNREVTDQDFGYTGENSVGDTVFFDANSDGVDGADADESGIPGVDVVVTWFGPDGIEGTTDDVVYPAATTDENGEYVVEGLPDGTYSVDVDESTLPDGLNSTVDEGDEPGAPIDGTSTVILGDDGVGPEDDRDQDFGYVSGGSISGTIVLDQNASGNQDTDESGIPGVTVTLTEAGRDGEFGTGDDVVRETTTDENGDYSFPGLPAGDYVVDVDETTLPDGVEITFDDDDGTDDPDGTMPVTLGENEDRDDVDAGYVGPGSISGLIYADTNGNGTQDDDEPGIPGQPITVMGPDGATYETVTDENGEYTVEGLPDGDYMVIVDGGIADNAENTEDPDGDEPNKSNVTLDPDNRDVTDQDFGYTGENSVGDTIFLDANADGLDGDDADEPGIPSVDVVVTWFGPDGVEGTDDDVVYPAATTDENGEYVVEGLPDGTFSVDVDETTIPDDLNSTVDVGDAAAGNPGAPIDGTSIVVLGDDGDGPEDDRDQDFGYVAGASISGTILLDQNADGIEDPTEQGIPGVTVTLTEAGPDGEFGTGDDVVRETTTDENGDYSFPGLPAGEYVVDVDETTLPDGVEITFDDDDGTDDPDGTMPVTVRENEDLEDVDAGYVGPGSIAGVIYADTNGNGTQDDDEPGVPGQPITVTDENGVVYETTTDENGEYSVEGLPDGVYTVVVDGGITDSAQNTEDPDGGTPNESTVTLDPDNREVTDQDFGYTGDNSVGDIVFLDANSDGVDGAGDDEPGIPGVDVVVTWFGPDGIEGTTDDVVYPAATTDENGEYVVEGLPDGTFSVDVDETTLPAGLDSTVDTGDAAGGNPGDPTDGTSTVVLGDEGEGPENDLDQDFGYVAGGSISGTVVLDLNGNEIRDGDEPGLAGIRVVLTLPDGSERETLTDENGDYTFPGLPAGDYVVTIDETTVPDGTEATFDPDGTDDGTTEVTLGENEDLEDVDFGYTGVGEIGGITFLDLDGDGVQDPDEPVVPGQTVTVTWAGPDGVFGTDDDIDFPTETDENGEYIVDGLPDGEYMVIIGPDGLPAAGTNTADPDGGEPNKSNVSLNEEDGRSQVDEDFGYQGDNSIGDSVYVDANGNGVQDDPAIDPPVPGAVVTITWDGIDGVPGTADDVTYVSTTDENGNYGTGGLPNGSYTVVVDPATLPEGTAPLVDPDDGTPDGQSTVELTGGTNADDQDFGVGGGATIGDEVWLDLDGDGVRDLGEPGLTGAIVTATYLGPDGQPGGGDDQVFTTTVDESGNYLFENIPAGTYDIRITNLPDGLFPTADPDGGDDNMSRVTVGVDETNLDQDFGYVGSAGVGDEIFIDLDGDGVRDPNEPGIEGVTVTITSAGPDGELGTDDDIVVTTTTDEDGRYVVEGLPSGTTQVTYDADDLPEGIDPLGDLDGGDPTSTVVTLIPGETNNDVDYSTGGDATLCGTVFDDTDGDGVQDPGELGIPGVWVIVTWQSPDGPVVILVETDANGDWCLENLPPGTYTVEVDPTTLPPGTTVPGGPPTVVLDAGDDEEVDTGTTPSGGIFGGVFNDTDRDGQRDPGETGAPGVIVILLDDTGTEVARTTTDSDGNYEFEDLPPGTYTVIIDPTTVPAGTRLITETDGRVDGRTTVVVPAGGIGIGGGFGVGPERAPGLPRTGSDGTGIMLRVALTMLLAGAALAMFRRRNTDVPESLS